jgi:Zn-dependent M28 family amino/carboxypeptidase
MLYILASFGVSITLLLVAWRCMIWMPGRSPRVAISALTEREEHVRALLRQDLDELAQNIGERNVSHRYTQLVKASEFIERSLTGTGYEPRRSEFMAAGKRVCNIDVERTGHSHPKEIIVVGAHYDTVPGSPGANDNGSAVVANLALARSFAARETDRTIRFAFFVNEEFPYYMTEAMGALRYAGECRRRGERVVGMISLETIGCYLDEPDSQRYPLTLLRYLYPTTGNFIAVVGNVRSRRLVHRIIGSLRRVQFPSEGMAAPRWLKDIFRSDHAAFWSCGYPAVMITDTANFRYPHYHTPQDTVDKINFTALSRIVTGLEISLEDLANH